MRSILWLHMTWTPQLAVSKDVSIILFYYDAPNLVTLYKAFGAERITMVLMCLKASTLVASGCMLQAQQHTVCSYPHRY